MDLTQTDVYYFAPQKAFGSDGGLWLALMSPAALARIEEIKASGRWIPAFLDLATAVEQSRLEQTYNTPALATIFLAAEQVDWMLGNGGLAWAAKRCAESAGVLYGWAERSAGGDPVRDRPGPALDRRSPRSTSTPRWTRRRWPRPCGPTASWTPSRTASSGRNQLRIALFPTIDPSDVEALTACIDYVLGARLTAADDGPVDRDFRDGMASRLNAVQRRRGCGARAGARRASGRGGGRCVPGCRRPRSRSSGAAPSAGLVLREDVRLQRPQALRLGRGDQRRPAASCRRRVRWASARTNV